MMSNNTQTRIEEAIAYMQHFADRTGLVSDHPVRRYLWTDAFAVCNFLGLAQTTGEQHYTELALQLADQVHHTLGKHRDDDLRSGWISGLSAHEGENHPTRGGLRIGKELPERGANESYNERLEWDRDGQYFHYLTKWMHALDQVALATGQPRFNCWARELAESSFNAFTYSSTSARSRRMYWKMSIDLTRAQVASMGQQDPLDGYITCIQLIASAARLPEQDRGPDLAYAIGQFAVMIEQNEWATDDPLGIGGLLIDAYRVYRLLQREPGLDEHLLEGLLSAAHAGMQYYARSDELQRSAEYRLGFRELGLAIGLHAVQHMWQTEESEVRHFSISAAVRARLQALIHYAFVRDDIESFWRDPDHQRASTWSEHLDINEVMLATSLVPDGFLHM